MTTNLVKNGQSFTSTTTEQEIEIVSPYEDPVQVLTIILVSGSVQLAVGVKGGSPVIDATYTTFSTANQIIIKTIDNGAFNLRVVGTGVISVNY